MARLSRSLRVLAAAAAVVQVVQMVQERWERQATLAQVPMQTVGVHRTVAVLAILPPVLLVA
jgi:hypothetical protein